MKIFLIFVGIIVGLFLLFTFGGGYYMYRFATVRNKKQKNYWKDELTPRKFLSDEDNRIIIDGWKYLRAQNWEDVSITSYDGLKLAGHYLEHPSPRGLILQVHGYRGCGAFDFSCAVKPFYEAGFSLLIIDQRASADSEGKHITFGFKERYDVVEWAKYVQKRFPGLPVIMDGVSMGASTVMLAAEVGYPDNVKAIIADCGYTSPGDICRKVLKQWFKLPPFPLYHAANFWVKILTGFDLDSISCKKALKSLKGSGIKLLIAHGKKDDFVPYWMSEENIKAFDECEIGDTVVLFTSEEADHGLSFLKDGEAYTKEMNAMFERAGI